MYAVVMRIMYGTGKQHFSLLIKMQTLRRTNIEEKLYFKCKSIGFNDDTRSPVCRFFISFFASAFIFYVRCTFAQ